MVLEPYLIFNGDCEKAFLFYKSVFGNDFTTFIRYNEMTEGNLMPEKEQEKILFISLPLGEGTDLMGNDATTESKVVSGTNFALSVSFGSLEKDKVKQIFDKLSEQGEILMPFQKTYWADWFGMCRDKFGIQNGASIIKLQNIHYSIIVVTKIANLVLIMDTYTSNEK